MNRVVLETEKEEEQEVDLIVHEFAAIGEVMREDVVATETVGLNAQKKTVAVLDHIPRIERRRQLSQDRLVTINQLLKIDLDRLEIDLNRPDTVHQDVTTIRPTQDHPRLL
jgi:hypothetical protein